MKNFINEFKKFAMRGNVIDMAVGIIIGAVLTLVVLFALVYMLKAQKKKEKMRLYRKVSAGWGVVFE